MYFYYDSTFLILIPGLLLTLYAQLRVSGTFNKYNKVESIKGQTAAQVCRQLLDGIGLHEVRIQRVSGKLSDHYDPRNLTLSLSEATHDSTSVAAIGVAAHEAGHAMQHRDNYAFLKARTTLVPVVNICSYVSIPLLILGSMLEVMGLVYAALALYASIIVFQLVTLPVELNASQRALSLLEGGNYLSGGETAQAKKVLSAAALTYLAATLVAMLQFLRLAMLFGRRRN
ncbi:zinc metallopeptidase [Eubacteriales bacterium OttesenSCG-928-N14]|nr:zinc metallopeptidase [Eubacteriales bacterium OttesenSCG-928-N14]